MTGVIFNAGRNPRLSHLTSVFYHFPNFQLTEQMDDGEYDYELYDGEELVAQGLLQIGDYENSVKTYTTTQNGYRQYNPET